MELTWHRATEEALEVLAHSRAEVLRADNKLPETEDLSSHAAGARAYYQRALADGSHVAYLVYDGEALVGTGGVCFYHVLPTYHKPVGYRAYIMNLYTHPDYRRRGIARRTLELLMKEARSRGVDRISLETSTMARPLYESFGFTGMPGEMYLPELN